MVDALVEIAGARDVSPAQVALNWLLAKPGVTSLIVGARTEEQLADNLAAVDWSLDAAEVERLDALSAPRLPYPQWHQLLYNSARVTEPWLLERVASGGAERGHGTTPPRADRGDLPDLRAHRRALPAPRRPAAQAVPLPRAREGGALDAHPGLHQLHDDPQPLQPGPRVRSLHPRPRRRPAGGAALGPRSSRRLIVRLVSMGYGCLLS